MIELKKNNGLDMIDEYMDIITKRAMKTLPEVKKAIKITDDCISIPTIKNYANLSTYNYNITQLKTIAKHYKLKISGNKPQLGLRIFSYLYFSLYAIKIQKIFRGLLVKKYKLVPAFVPYEEDKLDDDQLVLLCDLNYDRTPFTIEELKSHPIKEISGISIYVKYNNEI